MSSTSAAAASARMRREVYEEGLFIPIMKFVRRAASVNRDLINIVRNNVRENDKVVGDLYALAACNETGHRRLVDMLDEFGLADLDKVGAFILEHSRQATIERIAALPQRHVPQQPDRRRLRRADRAGGRADHRRGRDPGRFRRHVAA